MIKCKNQCLLEKFNGCCACCPERDACDDRCEHLPEQCGCAIFNEESGLTTFKNQQLQVLQKIVSVVRMKKECKKQEKELKDKLKQAMERFGVKKFESDVLNITYVAETTSTSIDSTKLKKLHPNIAAECSKTSKKSAYIKVEVKGGE